MGGRGRGCFFPAKSAVSTASAPASLVASAVFRGAVRLKMSIVNFDLQILRRCKNAVEARLAETRTITVPL